MPDYVNSILGGLSAAGLVSAIAWFFMKKWMERVEATPEKLVTSLAARLDEMLKEFKSRMDRLEQESRSDVRVFMERFRTKEESQTAWQAQNARDDRQEQKLEHLADRLARLEATCQAHHD